MSNEFSSTSNCTNVEIRFSALAVSPLYLENTDESFSKMLTHKDETSQNLYRHEQRVEVQARENNSNTYHSTKNSLKIAMSIWDVYVISLKMQL